MKVLRKRRWLRYTAVASLVVGLAVSGLLVVMSVAMVERPGAPRRTAIAADLNEVAWPHRSPESAIRVTSDGPLPEDLGSFGPCRVFRMGQDDDPSIDGFLLVTSNPKGNSTGTFKGECHSGERACRFRVDLENQNLLFASVMRGRGQPRGTFLYLSGIEFLSPGEQYALRQVCARGWNVVACTIGGDFLAAEKVTTNESGAKRLARRIDNHLADRTYAMESILAFLKATRPDFLTRPRVIVGMSAGAIALPTVVSRVKDIDAAVLIGGGADVASIIADSPLFRDHIQLVETQVTKVSEKDLRISHVPCLDREKREKFVAQTLLLSKLDPFHTARFLEGTPVLQVHARFDQIVPAATGEKLHERLGHPEMAWT